MTPRTIQAHCTFLSPPDLANLSKTKTAVAHCPLSNAYFSAQPFRLREALDAGVPVGLGTDIAGGYSIDIMNAMRQAVMVSRMREGRRVMASKTGDPASGTGETEERPLSIDWKEALYLATTGGAAALGLPKGAGTFAVGVPFDAQSSESLERRTDRVVTTLNVTSTVELHRHNGKNYEGVGPLTTFLDDVNIRAPPLTEDLIEKWWCVGDFRNRRMVWVQGRKARVKTGQ